MRKPVSKLETARPMRKRRGGKGNAQRIRTKGGVASTNTGGEE